jgi:ABC-2 type transport system permease protein
MVVFMAIGFAAAALVVATQQGGQVPALLAAALTLLSGAFFPLSVLPAWLRALADLSPLTYALRALRASTLPGGGAAEIVHDLAIVAGSAAVLLPLSVLCLTLALRRARATGRLASF